MQIIQIPYLKRGFWAIQTCSNDPRDGSSHGTIPYATPCHTIPQIYKSTYCRPISFNIPFQILIPLHICHSKHIPFHIYHSTHTIPHIPLTYTTPYSLYHSIFQPCFINEWNQSWQFPLEYLSYIYMQSNEEWSSGRYYLFKLI